MIRRFLCFTTFIVGVLTAEVALADAVYALDFRAPEECPEKALRAAIERRSRSAEPAPDGARFSVRVIAAEGGFTAETTLPDGTNRAVRASRCADVLDAVAFIVAVTLDTQPPSRAAPPKDPDRAERVGTAAVAANERYSTVGATFGVAGALSPALLPVGGAFLANSGADTPLTFGSRYSLLVGRASPRVDGVTSTFTFVGLDLDFCPVTIAGISACVGIEPGALGVSTDLASAAKWRFWGAARGGLRYELALGSWIVELTSGVTLPLVRDRFVVERADGSDMQLHRSGVSGFAGGGFGHRL